MARDFSTPTPPLSPLRMGVDVVQCTVTLRPTNYVRPKPVIEKDISLCTLLISFLHRADDRIRLRTLPGRLLAAKCDLLSFSKPASALPLHFAQQLGACATAVIALPSSSPPTLHATQAAVRALRNSPHQFILIVGICANPSSWAELEGIDGWVKCDEGDEAMAASQLFLMLATLMSPMTLNCIDDADVKEVLGSCMAPAQLLQGIWNSSNEEIIWLKQPAERTIGNSRAAVAFTLAHSPTLRDLGSIYRSLRAIAPTTASVHISASAGFLAPDLLSGICPIVVLWR